MATQNSLTGLKTVVTMSSIELVQVINDLRKVGKPELRHDNFMAKIEKHPGITSPKFLGHVPVPGPNGSMRESKCYNLPKRECTLMVMSESLEVQTRVLDRMIELEQRNPAHQTIPFLPYAVEFNSFMAVATMMGLPTSLALAESARRVKKEHGVDLVPLLTMSNVQDNIPDRDVCLEPTELAKRLGFTSARAMNTKMASLGLQEPSRSIEALTDWTPLGEARKHAFTHQWTKDDKHGYNLKWRLSFVRSALEQEASHV